MSRPAPLWDIFCKVIDNHGDLGVCWRLAANLAARGQRVRLWVDDATALVWMAPGALQGHTPGVQVLPWTRPLPAKLLAGLPPADVWVEAFGCDIPTEYLAFFCDALPARATPPARAPAWLNLEYLSAEAYVARSHALPSPVMHGPARGRTKWFFYPGFTPVTGGLLREADLAARQAAFDRAAWLAAQGIPWQGERLISLFCYEPAALPALLAQLAHGATPTRLLVTAGRATAAVQATLRAAAHEPPEAASGAGQPNAQGWGALRLCHLPELPQPDFDHLLWACDLNFVRGEDSLVRALWAGQAFVWHIYPQDDDAHHGKLEAFLDWLAPPASWRAFHRAWNGVATGPLPVPALASWAACAQSARERLLAQDDLTTQLLQFVSEKR